MSAWKRPDADRETAAYVLGRLQGHVTRLPRDEFGPDYALALEAAYRKVEDLIVGEIERVTGQLEDDWIRIVPPGESL